MRAAVMRGGTLVVDEVPAPVPGEGQILVETSACGICGSDLSALAHTDEFLQASIDSGTETFIFDKTRDLVLGHEFSGRVVALGRGAGGVAPGDLIVALPWALDTQGRVRTVGYANDFPGGYGERIVIQAEAAVRVRDGVSPQLASLTEPLAVGFGAVARSGIQEGESAIVIGCGPIGLSAIAGLAERGVAPIVASETTPLRRQMALRMGAHAAVDPREEPPVGAWRHRAEKGQSLVVYNCVGATGVINALLYAVPPKTRIMQIGSVMVDDVIRPVVAIYKDVTLEFCMTYAIEEFARTLDRISDTTFDAQSLITGEVGLEGIDEAVAALRRPDEHIKIVSRPELRGAGIMSPKHDEP